MNLDELKKSNDIIFECITGSHAYNLSLPTSDKDIRGIFCIPIEDRISTLSKVYEVSDESQDIKFYELEKFFHLATDCNPNIIELMFMPESCVLKMNDIGKELMSNRKLFISTKAYFTHSGYAYAQIKKSKGENKWVNNPKDKDPPKKEDFCWVIEDTSFEAGTIERDGFERMPFRPIKLNDSKIDLSKYHVAALEHVSNTFRLYYYDDKAKGVFRNGQLVCESISKEDELSKFEGLLIYSEQEYEKAMVDWKNYWSWVKNRNPNRWKMQESGKLDFDQKNMMHCIRLLMSGESILKTGEPKVRFEGEEQKYLMSIRNGDVKYEDIMKDVDKRMIDLELLYKTSVIPHHVNVKKINELFKRLCSMKLRED